VSIAQLIQRIWSLKFFILSSGILCLLGAFATIQSMPNRYIASAPIKLETQFEANAQQYAVDSQQIDAFVRSQAEIVKDPVVTGRVVDQLRWTESYQLAQDFRQSNAGPKTDFRTWLGNMVADRIVLGFTEGSPSFTLSYVGLSPEEARTMVTVLRDAYIENSLSTGRSLAEDQEIRLDRQLDILRERLQRVEERNSEFGRRNDVVLNADGISVTELQLRNAAAATLPNHRLNSAAPENTNVFQKELDEIDSKIARLSLTLGPNHPRLLTLKTERAEFADNVPEQSAPPVVRNQPSIQEIQRQREAEYLAKADAIATAKRYDAELKSLETRFAALSKQRQNYALDSVIQRPTASSGGAVTSEGDVYYPRATFAIIGAGVFGALLGLLLGLLGSLLQLRVQSDRDLQGLGFKVFGKRDSAAGALRLGNVNRPRNYFQSAAVSH